MSIAAVGVDYQVIGAHMVRLLTHIYGMPPAVPRVTADADAGIEADTAIVGELHTQLLSHGYRDKSGNHYARLVDTDSPDEAVIDLLVPDLGNPGRKLLGGRAFDGVPGLGFALAHEAIHVAVSASLTTDEEISFEVPVPDLEAATVLKLGATQIRAADKDIDDLSTLLEIIEEVETPITGPWTLSVPEKVQSGSRLDASRAALALCGLPPGRLSPRLVALLRKHVALPPH